MRTFVSLPKSKVQLKNSNNKIPTFMTFPNRAIVPNSPCGPYTMIIFKF